MRQTQDPISMLLSTNILSVAFTAAVTDIITTGSTAHGWNVGDKIRVSSSTTLPAGMSENTDYYVISVPSTVTLKVSTAPGGASINITDTGTGTHTAVFKSKVIDVEDFKNAVLQINTAGSANLTFKIQASTQEDVNFENAGSATNRWDYIQIIDLEDGATIDGDTGVSFSGTDDNRQFELNVNMMKWVCIDITTWTAGTMTASLSLSRD